MTKTLVDVAKNGALTLELRKYGYTGNRSLSERVTTAKGRQQELSKLNGSQKDKAEAALREFDSAVIDLANRS